MLLLIMTLSKLLDSLIITNNKTKHPIDLGQWGVLFFFSIRIKTNTYLTRFKSLCNFSATSFFS